MLNNKKNLHLKSGVSLVTVLLLMLVATIAATATYKLLTSGGLSSASRMKQQEAHQSALAGIENTRMWMTFHANDVGALIKAFIEGGNKPINLDARVRRWQRAKQDYHVWLTGVNTENSTYKLKILSSGVSQVLGNTNDVTVATWNESAIFNVDGLYQVKLLNEEVIVNDFASLPFEYNYFGGSTQSQGHIKAYSFLINGDMFGSNPPYTEKNLIVTGDVHITGNSVGAGGTACIGGNISADNGVFGNDFYVAGNATKGFTFPAASEAAGLSRAYLTGNVYIEGNLAPPDPGDQKFLKNMTLNGIWKTNLGAHESQVAGNLCLGPNAKVIIDKKNASRKFKVGGNVWAESTYPIGVGENCNVNGETVSGNCFEKNEAEYDHIILGDKTDSRIYIKSAHSTADYVTLVNNRTFVESKDYYRGTSGNAMGVGLQAKWDNKTTKVYKDLPPHLKTKTDAYYLYYYDGLGQDVDFIVSSAGGWGFGPQTKYASYYVENVPFYTTGGGMPGMYGYVAAGNHLLNMSGNTPTGSPFCKASPDKWRPECDVSPWFQSKGTIYRTFPAENNRGFECAESVKAHCDSVWRKDPGKGCPHKGKSTVNSHFRDGNADYKVDDILVTAYNKFEKYANKGCRDVTQWGTTMSERLNRCYRDNTSNSQRAKDSLYNGYQVVKVKNNWKADPKTPLKGKFIIIVTDALGQQGLPPTTSDSYVFLYLTHGTKLSQGNINTLQPALPGGIYNYFIYTKNDIDGLMFNDEIFSGSIYATAETCAKVGDIKTRQMVFNEAMMSDLSANAVVCPVSKNESPSSKELICGGAVTSSSSTAASSTSESFSSGSGSTSSEFDSYYISMAPQLSVRLESQGKSKEPLPEAGGSNVTELVPSFIVLPRIIYLPSDPLGSLTDYYNIQPLNGSTLKKTDVTVTCTGPGTLPASGDLYTSPNKLTKGLYTCTATATGHSSVPFWVHVGDDTRSTKVISFTDESQEMGASSTAYIKLNVPALGEQLVVNAYCPDVDNDAWEYVSFGGNGVSVTREGTSCTITLPAGSASTPTLATVKTNNAVEGSMVFHILPGEGYIPGAPSSSQLYIQSIAQLNRIEANSDDITAYCNTHQGCPVGDLSNWPDCDVAGVWVEPTGTEFINKVANNSWAIMVGNSQHVRLQNVSNNNNDCVVIIPEDNFIEEVTANNPYYLRASAKATTRTFKVGFKGNVKGKNPVITVYIGSRQEQCSYNDASESGDSTKTCTITTFKGESVAAKLTDNNDAEDFRHWTCTGASCPTTDPIVSTMEYDSFTISENGTELIAVFGEADKHCFFDEFKRESVECDAITEYCIDKCDNDATSVCTAADATGLFTNAKWHLISGILSQIITGSSGEIHIDKSVIKKKKQSAREPIVVMSTVNAGVIGTLKALINVPRATSSYDKSAVNIKKSGFMLRANKYGNDYFMLNLYENSNGVLEAQLTRGSTSLSNTLTNKNDQTAYVSNSKMVMVTAEFTSQDTLKVRASVGNYYGGSSKEEYECAFVLTEFNNTLADAAHEYVGFSLADPNFKIYGIGWKSGTYNSECYDTYPTVKCSFAAVATDGVIKTGEDVVPWVGHSGWFDSKGCSPIYYYYNGDDACGSPGVSGTTCNVYNFDSTKSGAHGYTDNNGVEHRTAKAWLGSCTNADGSAMAWANNAVQQAHCGAFWTGKFSECKAHQDLFSGSKSVNYGLEETIVLNNPQNLRAATLHFALENTDNNEIEIWLVSESDSYWGENDHESHSVKMNGNSATFDVIQEFATGSNGFDPENVKQIVLKNHGMTSATLTSITSSCENAIGITYCTATFDGDNWNVMTQVTNNEKITSLQVTATVEGENHNLNVTKQKNGDDGIAWNSNIAVLSIPDNPYGTGCCQGKSYKFNAKVVGEPGQEETKACSVSPDPIGKIGVNCSVIGSVANGARFPTFNIDFNGCPGEGCGYEVYIDGEKFAEGTEKTSARHSADKKDTTCKVTAGCEHTYTVKSTIPPPNDLFNDCSAKFKVLRKEEEVPPTVTCGISTRSDAFSVDPVFTGNRLYFLARNTESVDKTFNVTLKRGDATEGTATLQKWSQITNVKDLGTGLAKGTYTYSLYVGEEKVCDASVTVNDISGACSIGGKLYEGQQLSMNVSGVNANTQFTWTLKNGTETVKSRTIDCGTANCWNNTLDAPATAGSYTYTVTKGTNTICEGSVTIDPILTCSVTPGTVNKGQSYTFRANKAGDLNCWNCSFKVNGTKIEPPYNPQPNTDIEKTENTSGTKTLSFNCDCDNNSHPSCSTELNVSKTKPVFSCANNLKATVNTDDNVKIRLTGIVGCDDTDCSYSIAGTGSIGTTLYSGCTNTNCDIHAITNKSKSKDDTAIYVVTLANPDTAIRSCSVTFVEGATCTSKPDQIIPASNDNIQLDVDGLTNGCFTIKTGKACKHAQVQSTGSSGSGSFKINGTTISCGVYFDNNITASDEVEIEIPSTCTLSGSIYMSKCSKMIDPNNFQITKDVVSVDPGSYTISSVETGCNYVRFNCPSGEGCSVGVNSSTPISGSQYSTNIIVTPKPSANDILHITGDTQIFCTDWGNN